MANIYVRLPHYIASYLRNRDEQQPLSRQDAVRPEAGDPLISILQMSLIPNLSNTVNIACFSERQWIALRQGRQIAFRRDAMQPDRQRNPRNPLTLSEIYTLCDRPDLLRLDDRGAGLPDEAYPDEYVAFRLPSTVIISGREVRVQSDFYLPDPQPFIRELRDRFRMALTRFVAIDREIAHSRELKRSKMESLDRFMLRYDIRTGEREREQMKKLLNRSAAAAAYSFDADEDHGAWSQENESAGRRENRRYTRPVLCETTGETYPSISDFQRAFGVKSFPQVARAIRMHWRIHGVYVTYA